MLFKYHHGDDDDDDVSEDKEDAGQSKDVGPIRFMSIEAN